MAGIAGKGGSVKIGANVVTALSSWKLDVVTDTKKTTNFQSGGWDESVPTIKSWSGSGEGKYNVHGDASGQKALQDAQLNDTSINLNLMINAVNKYSGNAWVKKVNVEEPVDDIVKFSFDYEGTGQLTYA